MDRCHPYQSRFLCTVAWPNFPDEQPSRNRSLFDLWADRRKWSGGCVKLRSCQKAQESRSWSNDKEQKLWIEFYRHENQSHIFALIYCSELSFWMAMLPDVGVLRPSRRPRLCTFFNALSQSNAAPHRSGTERPAWPYTGNSDIHALVQRKYTYQASTNIFNVYLRGRAGYVRDRTKLIPIEPTKPLLITCETLSSGDNRKPFLITGGLFRVLVELRTRLFGLTGTGEADSNFSINQLLA